VTHHHQDPKQILVTCTEEFVTTDTLTDDNEELTVADIFATNGEKSDAAIALAATKSDVNVELAEKDHIKHNASKLPRTTAPTQRSSS
jgi:hypothetical protein